MRAPTAAAATDAWPRRALVLAGLVAGLGAALAVWSARYGVPVHDPAWLLLGLDAVLDGRVPVRDFQSYDPGRYWLLAPLRASGRIAPVWIGSTLLVVASALGLRAWRSDEPWTRVAVGAAAVALLLALGLAPAPLRSWPGVGDLLTGGPP